MILLSGCTGKQLNERVSLWRNDRIPYGTAFARENLKHVFPKAGIENYGKSPVVLNNDLDDSLNGKSALVIIAREMLPDEQELNALFEFIGQGNHVFISTFELGKSLQDSLRLETKFYSSAFIRKDSLTVSVLEPGEENSDAFTFPGTSLDNYFSSYDTSITWVRGYNGEDEPNLIEFDYKGGGSLVIQLAPIAYTNFFLLHKNNAGYYEQTISFLPSDVKQVYWDDYYRYHSNGKRNSDNAPNTFSKLRVFMKDPILRWAVILVFILFALVYLFESKRRQRVRPVPVPLGNPSVDFVKTVGSLYFQARDNKDLALKMSNHFADHVRSRYQIPLSMQDPAFAQKLGYKSGYDQHKLEAILTGIRRFNEAAAVSDEELLDFDKKLEAFYKQM